MLTIIEVFLKFIELCENGQNSRHVQTDMLWSRIIDDACKNTVNAVNIALDIPMLTSGMEYSWCFIIVAK